MTDHSNSDKPESTLDLLSKLNRVAEATYTGVLGATFPSSPAVRMLELIAQAGRVIAQRICDDTGTEQSTLSRNLGRLMAWGAVSRGASRGRRGAPLSLTDKGREALATGLAARTATDTVLLQGIPPEDVATFHRVAEAILRNGAKDLETRPKPKPAASRPRGDDGDDVNATVAASQPRVA